MAELNRSDIVSKRLRVVPLDIPEWDGTIYIRELSFTEITNYAKSLADSESSADTAALRICAKCVCTADGIPLFSADSADDMALLGQQSLSVIRRIAEDALKLNGLSEPGTAEKK